MLSVTFSAVYPQKSCIQRCEGQTSTKIPACTSFSPVAGCHVRCQFESAKRPNGNPKAGDDAEVYKETCKGDEIPQPPKTYCTATLLQTCAIDCSADLQIQMLLGHPFKIQSRVAVIPSAIHPEECQIVMM